MIDNVQIAKETIEIIQANEYAYAGNKIALSDDPQKLREVIVYSPNKVDEALAALDGNKRNSAGEINADMLDSLTSAKVNGAGKTLVLNFANAYHPGGGFLRGSRAQEEAICRCSSLYASITAENAAEMYNYNKANVTAEGSDYMLLSPHVAVFRDRDCEMLSEPYETAVITAAAPDLYEVEIDDARLAEVMRRKIKNVIAVAAQNSYDTLILGAWGCGAFGHDAASMAENFYNVLVEQNYKRLFDKIVFSVFAKYENNYNYAKFAQKFNK